jgi:peroxiredoxin
VEPRILPDPDESFLTGVGDDSRDPVLCSKLVMPILARLTRHAALTEMNRSADVNIAGEEQQLPILSILSEKDQHGNQTLAEIVVHPETFDPVQAEWTKTVITGEEQRFAILKIEFEKLRIGDPIPASYFVFSPPADAQLVDELPIPGLNGSALLNQPAPDFELEAAAGTKTRLSDLRGHAVLLAFSGGGCVTCSQQLADLAKIQSEYKTKGVAVLGIATEPNSVPTSAGGAPVPAILHDPDAKIHRLYRVQLVPTVVVIDAQGKVIRFLPGARDVATIEAALKTAGL